MGFIGFREKWPFEVSVDFSSIFMPTWLHFGSENPSKIDQKSKKNRSKSEVQDGMPLGVDFPPILLGLGRQLGSQNSPGAHQNRIKIELQLPPGFGGVLDASWNEKTSQIAPKILPKSHPNRSRERLGLGAPFFLDFGRLLGGSWPHHGASWVPSWRQVGHQNPTKKH